MLNAAVRDSNGISELSQIKLILPYKISCFKGGSEIPLIFLQEMLNAIGPGPAQEKVAVLAYRLMVLSAAV